MSWLQRYRLRFYLQSSMWVLSSLSILAGLVAIQITSRIERAMGWHMDISPQSALLVATTVASSMLTLLVLVSSAVLVAVQLASAQLTPRVIGLIYQNKHRKLALAVFTFTFTFSVALLARIGDTVPLLSGGLAAYGFLINLGLFLHFVDGIGKSLRPSVALRLIGLQGRSVLEEVYPRPIEDLFSSPQQPLEILDSTPDRIITNVEDGAVLAFDLKGLVVSAERSGCVIELVPQVGDFIANGDPLFRIFQGGQQLDDDYFRNSVAVGHERTMDQDPTFSFRIIVDIAIKALSPAINDPTTAVLAIDQIHHLLRNVGRRYLAEGQESNSAGTVRLVYRTPNWEDFVGLAVTEIRQYGVTSIQVTRRLQAMLEDLIETLPERRHTALRQELEMVESGIARAFPDPSDRLRASVADLQGVGGRPDEEAEHNRAFAKTLA